MWPFSRKQSIEIIFDEYFERTKTEDELEVIVSMRNDKQIVKISEYMSLKLSKFGKLMENKTKDEADLQMSIDKMKFLIKAALYLYATVNDSEHIVILKAAYLALGDFDTSNHTGNTVDGVAKGSHRKSIENNMQETPSLASESEPCSMNPKSIIYTEEIESFHEKTVALLRM